MPPVTSIFSGFRAVALVVAGLASLAPSQAVQAQGTGTGPTAPPGSFVITRDIPTRPAYEPGSGDATWVVTSPDQAFTDAIGFGLSVIDDAAAAAITGGPVMTQYPAAAATFQSTDHAISDTLISSGLAGVNQPGGGVVGSAIGGSLDAGLAAAGAGIDSALGSVNGALSNLGGLGQ